MKLQDAYDIIDNLKEGVAEIAGQHCFDIKELKNYLNKTKLELKNK